MFSGVPRIGRIEIRSADDDAVFIGHFQRSDTDDDVFVSGFESGLSGIIGGFGQLSPVGPTIKRTVDVEVFVFRDFGSGVVHFEFRVSFNVLQIVSLRCGNFQMIFCRGLSYFFVFGVKLESGSVRFCSGFSSKSIWIESKSVLTGFGNGVVVIYAVRIPVSDSTFTIEITDFVFPFDSRAFCVDQIFFGDRTG